MRMHSSRAITVMISGLLISALMAGTGSATPIDPGDSSLSMLGALPGGNLSIDTGISGNGSSLPTLTYGGGSLVGDIVSQSGGPDIAVFRFAGGSIFNTGNFLTVTAGSRPLALLFNGAVRLEGIIDVSGGTGGAGGHTIVGGRGLAVAGGGNGGQGGPFPGEDGFGPGGGSQGGSAGSQSGTGPGAGGGFGTDGGNGGAGVTTKPGGTAYGDPLSDLLQGGSGAGGGGGYCCVGFSYWDGGSGGGAGGGAIEIGALTHLDLVGAEILANGGDGGSGYRNGGGGSGGGIFLHAYDIALDSTSLLQANGGSGGTGAVQGGCGGAGRVEVITNTNGSFSNGGTAEAVGYGTCNNGALVSTSLNTIGVASPTTGPVASIPEPGALALFGLGLAGIAALRRRRPNTKPLRHD